MKLYQETERKEHLSLEYIRLGQIRGQEEEGDTFDVINFQDQGASRHESVRGPRLRFRLCHCRLYEFGQSVFIQSGQRIQMLITQGCCYK